MFFIRVKKFCDNISYYFTKLFVKSNCLNQNTNNFSSNDTMTNTNNFSSNDTMTKGPSRNDVGVLRGGGGAIQSR